MVKPARVCQCLSGGAIMKLTNRITNITKNNKGMSLLEILVTLGIISIVAAVAIPTYTNYTTKARGGVITSMLETFGRTVEIEKSLGTPLNNIQVTSIWGRVKSRDKDHFVNPVQTDFVKDSGTGWCMIIKGDATKAYKNMGGCLDSGGGEKIAGVEVKCDKIKATSICAALTWGAPTGCPTSGCSNPTAPTGACVNGTKVAISCSNGSNSTTATMPIAALGCNSTTAVCE